MNLILLRGVPGSGKSTLAEELISGRDAVHLEADQHFVGEDGIYRFDPSGLFEAHSLCQQRCWEAMNQQKELIVVSNTFTMEWEMVHYVDFAKTFGYKVFSIIVENRHGNQNVHDCPQEKVEMMRSRFEIKL